MDIRAVSDAELRELWSASAGEPLWETIFEGGADYALWPGLAGDHLIHYAGRDAFHLSADCLTISCAEPAAQGAEWQRMLLDTVLWTVALLRGGVLLHASAVEGPDGVVAIAADQGSGKSSLAAKLAVDGWPLFSDDILPFAVSGGQVIAFPGPSLMNLSTGPDAEILPEALGETLASLGDPASPEAWVLVRDFSAGECPLAAIVLLRRAGSGAPRVTRLPATPLDLTSHTLAFRSMPGAERRRFEVLSDLVERVPVFCLDAGVEVSPAELAATMRDGLQGLSHASAEDH